MFNVRRVAGLMTLAALASSACATGGPPPTIIVADKDVQTRWDTDPVTVRVDPVTGRTVDVRRNELYREYWVKDVDGEWYRIPRADWEAATIGQSLQVRPGGRERLFRPGSGECITPDNRWRC